jgi:hypothetical protein
MDAQELLSCMREAAAALAEFRHHLPYHSREAQHEVDEAREHMEYAILVLCCAARAADDPSPPR